MGFRVAADMAYQRQISTHLDALTPLCMVCHD